MRLSVGLGALGVPDLALLMDLRRLRALSPKAARSDHPTEASLPGRDGRRRRVVAAGEGEERIRPVRGLIVPRPVLPHPPALVPLLPVRPKPPQAQLASPSPNGQRAKAVRAAAIAS
jgi:hypothetical protein